MWAKLVVIAVFVLAAAAAGDALKEMGGEERVREGRSGEPTTPLLVPGRAHSYVVAGGELFHNRVLRSGAEHLSTQKIANAFPGESENPIDVSKIAVAPDGTLVLGVYRFRPGLSAEGAIELWDGRRLVGAFLVPPGYFGGGFAFSSDGPLIATISSDGSLNGVFDREGRLVSGSVDSFSSRP
jgi:WD40 repeat protein